MKPRFAFFFPATLVIVACGGGDTSTTATSTEAPATIIAATSPTTGVETTIPTTTVPATTIPATTVAPTTTLPASLSASDLLEALTAAGFQIGRSVVWTAATDPNNLLGRPGNYIEATWVDERVAAECPSGESDWSCGGAVEVFDDPQALAKRFDYLGTFASGFPGGYYMWRTDTAIIRIGFAFTPEEAAAYEAQLRMMYSSVEAFTS